MNSTPPSSPASSSESAELMYVKCASCGKWMDVKPGHINNISHSICPDCFKTEMHKMNHPGNPTTLDRSSG